MRTLAWLAALMLLPRSAAADEEAAGPAGARNIDCQIALGVIDVVPAVFEVGPYLYAGGGWRSGPEAIFSTGAGVEGTFGLARLSSGLEYGGAVELRGGPWLAVETPLDRVRGEGGLALNLGQTRHARWGTFGLRLGGGYGSEAAAHLVGVLSWGVRYVPARVRPTRGVCDLPKAPAPVAFASGARLFGALRRELDDAGVYYVVFGIELEPSWFLPPYSTGKWIGAAP